MAIPLLNPDTEDRDTKAIAFWAILAITCGLALVSLYGIWAQPGEVLGKIAYTLPVMGAEFLIAVAVMRAIAAPTWPRMAMAVVVSVGLSWYCVHNVERGIKLTYPELFSADAASLEAKASLRGDQSKLLAEQATQTRSELRADMATIRADITAREEEQKLMTASAPALIEKAQKLLQAKGLYNCAACPIDGRDETETAKARAAYGEQLNRELSELRSLEASLRTQLSGGVVEATNAASEDQIALEAQARERGREGRLITIGAWVLELSRSLGGVLFLGGVTARVVSDGRRRAEELAEQEHANRLAALRAQQTAAPQPANDAPAPEPDLTPEQRRSRNGGLAAGQGKAAERAANDRTINLDDWRDPSLDPFRKDAA